MGKINTENEIEGTCAVYNSKHEKKVSTYEKGGVANGMTIKYLDAIETTAEYSL